MVFTQLNIILHWATKQKCLTRSEFTTRSVIAKVLNYGLGVSEFKPDSRYDIHFQVNTIGNGMNPRIPPAMR